MMLVDFENSAPLFPGVHRSFKFALLSLGRDEPEARFAFFLTEPTQLAEPERNFSLSPQDIAAINPNTRTAPVFRSRADAELTAKIYANAPVLIDENKGLEGNLWGVTIFTRIWHMTEDAEWFRSASELSRARLHRDGSTWSTKSGNRINSGTDERRGVAEQCYLPLYEAKMVHQFDHRWAGYADDGMSSGDLTDEDKRDPHYEPVPRYWVPEDEVRSRLAVTGWQRDWLFGHRGLTNVTNERTFISAIVPRFAIGNSFLVWIFSKSISPDQIGGLAASCTSLVVDFAARQKLGGTNLNLFLLFQFPIFPPAFYTEPRLAFIVPKVLELTYTSHALAPFARDLGHDGPPFVWDEDGRALLRADLDAFYARAYGLTRDELRYILDPADVKGLDYPSETFRVLKDKEIRQFGEYRTRRLVLAAWDRMDANREFAAMGM